MNRFSHLFSLVLLLTLAATGMAVADHHSPRTEDRAATAGDETRVALGVRAPRHLEVALLTAEQLHAGQGLKADEVTIVVCGPASEGLTREGPLSGAVQAFVEQGGRLAVCGLTLKELNIDPTTLLTEVEVVANGFIELLRLQTEGYFTIEL